MSTIELILSSPSLLCRLWSNSMPHTCFPILHAARTTTTRPLLALHLRSSTPDACCRSSSARQAALPWGSSSARQAALPWGAPPVRRPGSCCQAW